MPAAGNFTRRPDWTFEPADADDMFTKPFFTTIGMTDESCGTVYGYAYGVPSKSGQEATEEIDIVLADRAEVRRILKEERVGNYVRLYAYAFFEHAGRPCSRFS